MADASKPRKKKLRCPACRSTDLSDEGAYASFDNHARYKEWEEGLIGYKDLMVSAETARFCLECGYMLLFTSQEKIDKLKAGPTI